MNLCVVIALYNEAENVAPLLDQLLAVAAGPPDWRWRFIFVIEGEDGTQERVAAYAARDPRIESLYQPRPSGLGAAFRRGFAQVPLQTDVVVTMDGDLNHMPTDVPRLVRVLEERGADIVVGSRRVPGGESVGTPRWKKGISWAVGKLMVPLYPLGIWDQSSGFRVYRAEALRRIRFSNSGFAFLPEMLVDAHRLGMRLAEEPIRYIYRTRGVSKMRFGPTSFSYSMFLLQRFDRLSVLAGLLLLLALGIRLLLVFPVGHYPEESDRLLAGMCAYRVMEGEWPTFFAGARIGALPCYLTALAMWMFGETREALLVWPVALSTAAVLLGWLFFRRLLGRGPALLAMLLLALPSPQLMYILAGPTTYPEMLATVFLALWLGAKILTGPSGRGLQAAFGFAAGLAIWQSLLAVPFLLPMGLALYRVRPELARIRSWAWVAGAATVSAAPLWIAHSLHLLPQDTLLRGPRGSFLNNVAYIFGDNIRQALAARNVPGASVAPGSPWDWASWAIVAVYAAACVAACWRYLPVRTRETDEQMRLRWVTWILLGMCALTLLLNLATAPGSVRGPTARYLWPVFVSAVAFLLIAIHGLGRRVAAAGWAMALLIAGFYASFYPWPQGELRRRAAEHVGADRPVVEYLRSRGVDVVVGNYWVVYWINFASRTAVMALPMARLEDWVHYEPKALGSRHWALMGGDGESLRQWAAKAGIHGTVTEMQPGYLVLVPEHPAMPPLDALVLRQLRQ